MSSIRDYLNTVWSDNKDSGILKQSTIQDALKLWDILDTTIGSAVTHPSVSLSPSGSILFAYRINGSYLEIEVEADAYLVYHKTTGDRTVDSTVDFECNANELRDATTFVIKFIGRT